MPETVAVAMAKVLEATLWARHTTVVRERTSGDTYIVVARHALTWQNIYIYEARDLARAVVRCMSVTGTDDGID